LHFQAILAPIFLWGMVLAQSRPDALTWLVFVAYHVFLYGGATAFNSVYDRDTGPVGGLRRPPPVDPFLLPWSLGVLAVGLLLAAARPATALVYAVILALALAYSYPGVRLKARPFASVLTIGAGQGVLPFVAGWLATPSPHGLSPISLLGALSAAFVAIALYPLTQLYQIEEDRQRGDRTVAVVLGPSRCFALSHGLLLAAAGFTVATIVSRFGWMQAVFMLACFAAIGLALEWWRRHFSAWGVVQNFHAAMALTVVGSAGFAVYLVWQLVAASMASISS